MSAVLDAFPFPWHDPVAQQLHTSLTQLFPSPQAAASVAQPAGVEMWTINSQQAPAYAWKEILDAAATAGLTRALVQRAHDVLSSRSPLRPFLEDLLRNRPTALEEERRTADGAPSFISNDDEISEPEALLYHDDLTLQIGRVPALVTTLTKLFALSPAVCRLEVDVNGHSKVGTGFRIGTDQLLTNWHVLHRERDGTRATTVTAEFGYEDDGDGGVRKGSAVGCDVETMVGDQANDWAVVRTKGEMDDGWPVLRLSTGAEPVVGHAAYIIQHPGGTRKRLGFVRNQISFADERVVHYLTDTQGGSSGSPVFDADAKLIALHHAGGRPQEVAGKTPVKKNEGIRISRIRADLAAAGIRTT